LLLSTGVNFQQGSVGTFLTTAMASFNDDTLRTGEETNFYLQGSMTFDYDSLLVTTASFDIDLDPEDDRLSNFIELMASSSGKKVTTITGGKEGQELTLMGDPQLSGDVVTIENNSNINLTNNIDVDLNPEESIKLIYHSGKWYQTVSAINRIFLPISTSVYNTLGEQGADGSGFVTYMYGASSRDTLLSDRALRADDHILSGDISFNGDVVFIPEEKSLAAGSADLAITKAFLVLDGDGGSPSSISDFTGLKTEGQKITVMNLAADGDGFTILDNVNIVCAGGANIVMTGGDIAEFIYMDGKWYSTSPVANNN